MKTRRPVLAIPSALRTRRELQRKGLAFAVASCFASGYAGIVLANPTGAQVISGSAAFNQTGKTLNITNSNGAIIQWQGFSVAADEVTRFIQSGANSAVLNRVVGSGASNILGQLLSNGRVFLINPNGVFFGAGSVVDVAGLTVSTLGLSDADFLAGRFKFTDQIGAARIVNQGSIQTAAGGQVYLVAPNVENHGVITSPGGQVILAAGKSVELVNAATPDVRVELTAPQNEAINVGQIVASAGRVGIYGTAIRNSGLVSATGAAIGENGKIVFRAKKDVTLEAASKIDASGAKGGLVTVQAEGGVLLADGRIEAKGSADKGGTVHLLGERVGLVGNAVVDASGSKGGGTVLLGGDYQGKNVDVQNAQRTHVGRQAFIRADAGNEGDGGKIIAWSDGLTTFLGSASAQGGTASGDGGFVEVSGKENLLFDGQVNTLAPNGKTGTLLLDPANITIQDTAGDLDGFLAAADGLIVTGDTGATLSLATLEAVGAATDVELRATNSISINLTGGDKEVTLDQSGAVRFYSGAGGFSMASDNSINVTGSATLLIDSLSSNTFGVGDGPVSVSALQTTSGSITLRGTTINLGGNITTTNGAFTADGPVVLGANIVVDTKSAGSGADVSFNAALNGTALGLTESLTLNAGTGTLNMAGIFGAGGLADATGLTAVTVTDAGVTNFNGAIAITGALTQTNAATGATTFGNTVSVGSATLRGTSFDVQNSLTSTGAIAVTNSGTFTKGATGAITAPPCSACPSPRSASGSRRPDPRRRPPCRWSLARP